MAFGVDDDSNGRKWFFRIASIAGLVAAFVAIGLFVKKGQSFPAGMTIMLVVPLAVVFSWSWTGSVFGSLGWAKRYVEGVEGDQRHEWYAFKGQRVRVFLDEHGQPWFALNEIAFILSLKVDGTTFRHYGPREYGIAGTSAEACLSEIGLRRLIKYSAHRDAGALGLWLERDVLRVLRNRRERNAA